MYTSTGIARCEWTGRSRTPRELHAETEFCLGGLRGANDSRNRPAGTSMAAFDSLGQKKTKDSDDLRAPYVIETHRMSTKMSLFAAVCTVFRSIVISSLTARK